MAALIFALALTIGSITDAPRVMAPRNPAVLTGDFHVHAAPGDGFLPVWEIQREAERRDLDVVAITNHNHNLASRLARLTGLVRSYPIVIDSQELTTPHFHVAAVGVTRIVDWRLPPADVIADVHAAGGVAIAAHPGRTSWTAEGDDPVRMLDGVEVGHSDVIFDADAEREMSEFFARARALKPDVAPIGSSDFHVGAPLAPCRTYVLATDASREGVMSALRDGRTVATCPGGRVIGREEYVGAARQRMVVEQPTSFGYGPQTWLATVALCALAIVAFTRGSGSR